MIFVVELSDLSFLQFPDQSPAVHSETPRTLGDVEVAFGKRGVDAFPFNRLDRTFPSFNRCACIASYAAKGFLDIVSIGRLGQILGRAEFDLFDGCSDGGKAGKHDDAGLRISRVDHLDARQARSRFKLGVDYRELEFLGFE